MFRDVPYLMSRNSLLGLPVVACYAPKSTKYIQLNLPLSTFSSSSVQKQSFVSSVVVHDVDRVPTFGIQWYIHRQLSNYPLLKLALLDGGLVSSLSPIRYWYIQMAV